MPDHVVDGPFERFYRAYYDDVRRYAAARFGDAEADDVAQETMLRAMAHFGQLSDERPAWPWLRRVAGNVGVDRQRHHRRMLVDERVVQAAAPSVPDESVRVAIAVDLRPVLGRAMRRLKAGEREVIALHEVSGESLVDIAAAAGVSANTVRQRLFRARRSLIRNYREMGGVEYALPPPLAAGPSRLGERITQRAHDFADAVTAHAPRLSEVTERATFAAVAALAAAAIVVPAPPATRPAESPRPSAPPVAPAAQAPVLGGAPGLTVPVVAAADRVAGSVLRGPDEAAGPFADFAEDWEDGLGGWTVVGASARQDCETAHRGLCSLRLDPADGVSVSHEIDARFRAAVVVTAHVLLPESVGTAEFRLRLETDTETVEAAFSFDEDPQVVVRSDRHGQHAGIPGWYSTDEWYRFAVVLDPVRRSAEVNTFYGNGNATIPLATSPSVVRRLTLSHRRGSGAGRALLVDTLSVLPHAPACNDGLDNDRDGFVDTEDRGCGHRYDNVESDEPQCADRKDNDGDGRVDLDDDACDFWYLSSEAPQCDDGVDNDGDGRTDFPDDPKCRTGSDPSEVPDCADGVDNDEDGTTDFSRGGSGDLGCASAGDDTEFACVRSSADEDSAGAVDGHRDERPAGAGVCLDPVRRLGPVAVATDEEARRVTGYVDVYRFPSGHTLHCVTLAGAAAELNPCAAAGGRYEERGGRLVALEAELVPQEAQGGDPPTWICTARLIVVFGERYADPLGSTDDVLTLC